MSANPEVVTFPESAESEVGPSPKLSNQRRSLLMTRSVFEAVDWRGFPRYNLIKSKEGPI